MSGAFFILTVICVACYGLFRLLMWHVKRRHLYELLSKLQGPPVLPILGNAHMIFGNGEHLLNKLTQLSQSYPSPSRLWIGPLPFVVITDAEHIKEVCLNPKTLEKGNLFRNAVGPLIGEGLLASPVSKWRLHRRIIQPTFNKKILDSFVQIFAEQSSILTEQMAKQLDGPEFKIIKLLLACSLDMICETAMGVQIGAQTSKYCQYVESVRQVMNSFSRRYFNFWLKPDFIFYRTNLGIDQRKNVAFMREFTENVIKAKHAELLERNSRQSVTTDEKLDATSDSTSVKEALLDHLMKLTDDTGKLSDNELREEINEMILAGNATVANTMSYAMLMLASHTDVQDKAYQELYEIYGDADSNERPVVPSDLVHMKYLERIIRETLRLFPVFPFIVRELTEDLTLGGHLLPQGSYILGDLYSIHRQEKYWPDPLKFDPERFSPDESSKRHPYAFVPFGGGPRNCLGQNYGMIAIKTAMANILRRYVLKKDHIVPPKNIRLSLESAIHPVKPITLRIELRTYN